MIAFISNALHGFATGYPTSTILFAILIGLVLQYYIRINLKPDPTLPPVVPYFFPFFGSMVTYGMNPVQFLKDNQKIYGDNFTFLMFGRRITHCLGPDGNHLVLNAKHTSVNAEDAYRGLTKPVFGPGVVYDCPNSVLLEQKRMIKYGLTTEYLKTYVTLIEQETIEHLAKWGKEGKVCIFKQMGGLIIKTASRCLLGEEVRSQLDESFAEIYENLDRGFTPVHFLFDWLPLPSFWRRDASHLEARNFFLNVIKNRRASNIKKEDMLQALMSAKYKNGDELEDEKIACILIALLMAGQHTSSTTSTWAFLYLAQNPSLIDALREEQVRVLGANLPPLTLESLKKLDLLDSVVRETLRIKPPLLEIMRMVTKPVPIPGTTYAVPPGHYIAAAPVVSAMDEAYFPNPEKFDPYRWTTADKGDDVLADESTKSKEDPSSFVDYGFGSVSTTSARSPYLPFGGGRHRCIGDAFAYIQLKTIIATFVRNFDIQLDPKVGLPDSDFTNLVAIPVLPATIHYKRR
ncbi:Lanosterol 14-alpha-demethylase [Entomophthora muscae]|uniref:Lanosterol 14-alpha-demethylase n=1 Tax=Entomophthora muscae TaxID=34485 RepID=A0ACC2UEN9_9FUNG|nr:Lanosterol 14-alpha-demethylase [Entomophthora muscae]